MEGAWNEDENENMKEIEEWSSSKEMGVLRSSEDGSSEEWDDAVSEIRVDQIFKVM